MKKILELIKEYEQIILYRHVNPDYDAFGSQLGMYWVLKDLFPKKTIVLEGEFHSPYLSCYPEYEEDDKKDIKSLGIVFDTANKERIDGDISLCDKIIKIDHHIIIDSYGDMNIEVETASSCSEIVTLLLKEEGIKIPKNGASSFYLGIVGDSNRFLYNSTTPKTFEAASYLLESHICIEELYQSMYLKSKKDIEIKQYIYNHYEEDQGVAWYYLSDEALRQLEIPRQMGSEYVYTLADIKEFSIWLAITENIQDHNYRVSIRSRDVAINEIANEFHGGGHAFASGATLNSLDELPLLIKRLKEKLHE